MTTSIVDGTVEAAEAGRRTGGFTVFKSLTFKLDDGSSRTLTKMVVKKALADEIVPGAKGRFYLFQAFDLRGVHGLRTPDGRAVYAFPGNNKVIFLILGVVNFLWIAFKVAVDAEIPLLGAGLMVLAVVGWYFMGKGEKEAKRQFDADNRGTA